MDEKINILVIEDDTVIASFLQTGLQYEGYNVTTCAEGKTGMNTLKQNTFHLLILDVMLPDTDGFSLCQRLREQGFDIPVLMLTVKNEIADRVKGLDSGADDYLTKPFDFNELLARIRALLRRSGKVTGDNKKKAGDIMLDTETREVRVGETPIVLTPTEFALLELFLQFPRKVFSRETLLNRVLGYDYDGGTNIIDVHVNHLRKKLKDNNARLIRTVYGVGYAFYPAEDE
ncbi:response regulator transcription factor [Candidatus Sulfidibacterium hydrothermale]|uniref:response regulator transcription factor n=1 Tax=Candidatus Sulfidibacterium hydrothermale TaxID=2875962 RepID=UPI001F0AC4EA|nr:response regulator transcription factor [Candidatus Sulfidibacterium hydrothermale]UBM63158.1 response regulator transcription factor [Candidatus Sulfidibacterium hydrothermale]